MENPFNLDSLKWGSGGLVPAIAQDARTGEVLMQAYMNREALELTLQSGRAHYYSRSRSKIWLKGETSGHFQRVMQVIADCDCDSILLKVIQTGAACHTGSETCYFNEIKSFEKAAGTKILFDDFRVIKERREKPEEGSYTNYLFEKGADKICKKIAEEAGEVIIAAKNNNKTELANEIADLYYHTFVLLVNQGMDLTDVLNVLQERRDCARARQYKSSN